MHDTTDWAIFISGFLMLFHCCFCFAPCKRYKSHNELRWFIESAQNRLRKTWKKNKTAHFEPKQQIMLMTDHIYSRSHQFMSIAKSLLVKVECTFRMRRLSIAFLKFDTISKWSRQFAQTILSSDKGHHWSKVLFDKK